MQAHTYYFNTLKALIAHIARIKLLRALSLNFIRVIVVLGSFFSLNTEANNQVHCAETIATKAISDEIEIPSSPTQVDDSNTTFTLTGLDTYTTPLEQEMEAILNGSKSSGSLLWDVNNLLKQHFNEFFETATSSFSKNYSDANKALKTEMAIIAASESTAYQKATALERLLKPSFWERIFKTMKSVRENKVKTLSQELALCRKELKECTFKARPLLEMQIKEYQEFKFVNSRLAKDLITLERLAYSLRKDPRAHSPEFQSMITILDKKWSQVQELSQLFLVEDQIRSRFISEALVSIENGEPDLHRRLLNLIQLGAPTEVLNENPVKFVEVETSENHSNEPLKIRKELWELINFPPTNPNRILDQLEALKGHSYYDFEVLALLKIMPKGKEWGNQNAWNTIQSHRLMKYWNNDSNNWESIDAPIAFQLMQKMIKTRQLDEQEQEQILSTALDIAHNSITWKKRQYKTDYYKDITRTFKFLFTEYQQKEPQNIKPRK